MAAGANLGEKLFGMVKTIGPVFQSYAPGLGLLDLAVGVAGAVILYFVVQSKIKNARKFRRDMEYGSARWGTEADMSMQSRSQVIWFNSRVRSGRISFFLKYNKVSTAFDDRPVFLQISCTSRFIDSISELPDK